MNLACVLVGALILVVPATSKKDSVLSVFEGKMLENKFAKGRSQILAAELTPECREIALKNLEDAKTNVMTCDGAYNVMADIGGILDQAFNSTSDFIEDLNTLFNGIPGCLENYSWYNIIGMIFCFSNEFKPTMRASEHVNNFTSYYMDTINKIKELIDCIQKNRTETHDSVNKIVSTASFCSKPTVTKRTLTP